MSGPMQTAETRRQRFWQRVFAGVIRALAKLELLFDRVFWGLRRRFGHLGPLQVVAYRGYGSGARAHVRGRVLEASVLERSLPNDSRLRSVRRMLRRFNSREVPEATVTVTWGEQQALGRADDEGYFDVEMTPALVPASEVPEAARDWNAAQVEVTDCPVRGFVPVRSAADILIPSDSVELGIISDIDDTVLQTHVTQKLKMIWVTLSGSAFTRMPFEGTSELYRALSEGRSGRASNPVFYVSKSPWNLYDFLVDFMDHHQLPRGPLLLRDIGLREAPPIDHKTEAVQRLLETYPQLPFVLIGDSGERDPDIYLTTAARYPGRIKAIYIRDLGGKHGSAGRADALSAQARSLGTEMLWVEHAREALEHARRSGLVRANS
jgi:phosphatidate phosphatase APP1